MNRIYNGNTRRLPLLNYFALIVLAVVGVACLWGGK